MAGSWGSSGFDSEYNRIPLSLRDIIPAGPWKEGALVCSISANLGPARKSSAGLAPLEKGDYPITASLRINLLMGRVTGMGLLAPSC